MSLNLRSWPFSACDELLKTAKSSLLTVSKKLVAIQEAPNLKGYIYFDRKTAAQSDAESQSPGRSYIRDLLWPHSVSYRQHLM